MIVAICIFIFYKEKMQISSLVLLIIFITLIPTIFNLFTSKSVSSNTTTELLSNPLILQENEILKVQAADANRLQVIASVLEVQPRTVLGGAAS